jgi:hypothetical protein
VAGGQEAVLQQRGELQSLREQLGRLQQALQQCQDDVEGGRAEAQRCVGWGGGSSLAGACCCWQNTECLASEVTSTECPVSSPAVCMAA